MSWSDRDSRVIWHPFTQMQLAPKSIAIVRGEGTLLFDENGKSYIDAISSWWVNLHGHAHPYIAQKVHEQLQRLEHVIFAGFTHPGAVELAERLLDLLPQNQQRVFFSDNGSTAVEVALKMTLQYWYNLGKPKYKVVALENSYHGDTFGAMAAGARNTFSAPFDPLLFDVERIQVPVEGAEEQWLQRAEQIFASGEVAAFIFEPLIQGAGGMVMYSKESLEKLLKLCKQYGVIAIADEVMTGFFRTGSAFATSTIQLHPDIYCLSKGLTGGTMAMGITTCTSTIYDAFLSDGKTKAFYHGHSYTANPVACSAALASLDLITEDGFQERVQQIEQMHIHFSESLKGSHIFSNIRQCGTIWAAEVGAGEEASYFSNIRDKLYEFALSEGVLLRPLGNTIYIMPPYCIKEEELKQVYEVVRGMEEKLKVKN